MYIYIHVLDIINNVYMYEYNEYKNVQESTIFIIRILMK